MRIIVPEYFEMTYNELVQCFLKKYGAAKYNYFHTPECKSYNKMNSRTKEGLEIHHIDENKYPMLSASWAKAMPFECQKAERLVYVNVFEHLLLHIKIWEEEYKKCLISGKSPILGHPGIYFISNRINDYFSKDSPPKGWNENMFNVVADYYDDYVSEIKYHLCNIASFYPNKDKTLYQEIVRIIKRRDGIFNQELYNRLTEDYRNVFKLLIGDIVEHKVYGVGIVKKMQYKDERFFYVTVDFEKVGEKEVLGNFAGIKRVEA